jgi:hypothetical protein
MIFQSPSIFGGEKSPRVVFPLNDRASVARMSEAISGFLSRMSLSLMRATLATYHLLKAQPH